MSIQVQSKVEHKMVELKTRVQSLEVVRSKLAVLGAKHIGTFKQVDVYFNVPQGKLKLREVEGNKGAELIYYERENIAGPRKDDVFILQVQEADVFKNLLERLLKTSAIIEKVREIYQYKETQIHLDRVKKLGNFVELERKTPAVSQAIRKNQQTLKTLMEKLGIETENLEKLSYSDLIYM